MRWDGHSRPRTAFRISLLTQGLLLPLIVELVDTAGTEQFMSLHSLYIKSGDGFALFVAATDHSLRDIGFDGWHGADCALSVILPSTESSAWQASTASTS